MYTKKIIIFLYYRILSSGSELVLICLYTWLYIHFPLEYLCFSIVIFIAIFWNLKYFLYKKTQFYFFLMIMIMWISANPFLCNVYVLN